MNLKWFVLLGVFFCQGCGNAPVPEANEDVEEMMQQSIARLFSLNEIDSCIWVGESFVKQYPNNDIGWRLLSSAYLSVRNDSLAMICVKKALEINPKNAIALANYGRILDGAGDYEEAVEYYEKSIEADDNIFQTYSNYAGNRLLVGDYESAVTLGEKAVDLGGKITDKGILCLAYYKAGDFIKGDSLYKVLDDLKYSNLDGLNELVSN